MKLLRILVLLSVIPAVMPVLAFGQRGGGGHGGGGGARSGGGGARMSGGGGSVSRSGFSGGSVARGGSVVASGGGVRVGGNTFHGNTVFHGGTHFVGNTHFFGGRYYYGGYYPGLYLGFGYGGYPYYPYSYYDPYAYGASYGPSYYDGGYDYGNAGYAGAPAPAEPPQDPTVFNQSIGTGAASGSFYRAPDFYLIAFNDHTIQAAVSYSVEGDQIRYTTREHEERIAPLSSIDRRFSEQINRDRRVEFRLP